MKATSDRLPIGKDWAYEIKWDGMRALTVLSGAGQVSAYSSRGNDITARFPELADLSQLVAQLTVVLDGEIVALDDNGLPSFSRLQGRMHLDRPHDIAHRRVEIPVIYVIFDVLHLDGSDTIGLGYDQRRQLLETLVEPGPTWQLASVHREGGAELLAAVAERGMEGIVAKRVTSTYQPGQRSPDWAKVKARRRQEFVVGGWMSGEGARAAGIGGLLIGYRAEGQLRFAGRVGSGLSDETPRALLDRFESRIVDASPFTDEVATLSGRTITFVEPDTAIEVEFGEWTPIGHLRHPVYLGRRADVDPLDVIREPDPAPGPQA